MGMTIYGATILSHKRTNVPWKVEDPSENKREKMMREKEGAVRQTMKSTTSHIRWGSRVHHARRTECHRVSPPHSSTTLAAPSVTSAPPSRPPLRDADVSRQVRDEEAFLNAAPGTTLRPALRHRLGRCTFITTSISSWVWWWWWDGQLVMGVVVMVGWSACRGCGGDGGGLRRVWVWWECQRHDSSPRPTSAFAYPNSVFMRWGECMTMTMGDYGSVEEVLARCVLGLIWWTVGAKNSLPDDRLWTPLVRPSSRWFSDDWVPVGCLFRSGFVLISHLAGERAKRQDAKMILHF